MPSHNKLSPRLLYALVLVAAAVGNYPLVWGQFVGEDEVGQLSYSSAILENLWHFTFPGSLRSIAGIFVRVHHPPVRYFLSMPGILLFPNTEFGLRFASIVLSLYMTWQAMRLGDELGGWVVGLATGLLLSSSSIYTWTSMAFGWSLIAAMLIHSIRLLNPPALNLTTKAGRVAYLRINLFVLIAFLVNTSCLLFFASTVVLYGAVNRRNLRAFIRASAPFGLFYVFYYLLVLGIIPYVCHVRFGDPRVAGQFAHTFSRVESELNYESFIENLKGLNAYFVPFGSWVVLAFSLARLVRKNRIILYWLLPFLLAWSFLLRGNTQSYFLLGFIAILPFGVALLFSRLRKKPALAVCLVVTACAAVWNYVLFWRPYTDLEYPYRLLRLGYAQADRKHNVIKPYREIGKEIDRVLGENEKFVHDLSGCFTRFYYTEKSPHAHHSRYAGLLGSAHFPLKYDPEGKCHKLNFARAYAVKAIVTERELCPSHYQAYRTFSGSRIKLYLLD